MKCDFLVAKFAFTFGLYRYAAVEPSFNVMGLVLSGINLTLSAMQVGLALLSPRYFAVKTPML
jgi:hypothetical protein